MTTRLTVTGTPGLPYSGFDSKAGSGKGSTGPLTRLGASAAPRLRYGLFASKTPAGASLDVIVTRLGLSATPRGQYASFASKTPSGASPDVIASGPGLSATPPKRTRQNRRRQRKRHPVPAKSTIKVDELDNKVDNLTLRIKGEEYQPVTRAALEEELKRLVSRTTITAIQREHGVSEPRAKRIIARKITQQIRKAKQEQQQLGITEEEMLMLLLLIS